MPHTWHEIQVQVHPTPVPKNFVRQLLKMPGPHDTPPGSPEWEEARGDPACHSPEAPLPPALPRHLYVIWFLSHLGLRGKKL